MKATFAPTPEQDAVTEAFATGNNLVVVAGAGAGKTSTLMLLAEAAGRRKGLYITYSKALADEAAAKFAAARLRVECRTAHSLAYREHGRRYQDRLRAPRLSASQTARLMGLTVAQRVAPDRVVPPTALARWVDGAVRTFGQTADSHLDASHFALPDTVHPDYRAEVVDLLIPAAQRVWDDLAKPTGEHRYTHDTYLAQWARTVPVLGYDYVLLDESQDASPEIAGVFTTQAAQKVAVGDPSQTIYSWRGAVSAMNGLPGATRLTLSQSFRFGPALATEANRWLDLLHAELRITGSGPNTRIGDVTAPEAALYRTNAGAMSHVMFAHAQDVPVALVGGGDEVRRLALAAIDLRDRGQTSHPELVGFSSWHQVTEYVEEAPGGSDLKVMVSLIDAHGPEGLIAAVDACVPENQAAVTVSTAHKSKGREWDLVQIGDDFTAVEQEALDRGEGREELMLAYVAITRARLHLDPGSLDWAETVTAPPAPKTPAPVVAPEAAPERALSLREAQGVHGGPAHPTGGLSASQAAVAAARAAREKAAERSGLTAPERQGGSTLLVRFEDREMAMLASLAERQQVTVEEFIRRATLMSIVTTADRGPGGQ